MGNNQEFFRQLNKLGEDIVQEVKNSVFDGASAIETTAKNMINKGPRTGKIYTRKKVKHQASAFGEPPKTDTGNLVANIQRKRKDKGFTYEVGTFLNPEYGIYLEFGTTKMEKRPWLLPSYLMHEDEILNNTILGVNKKLGRLK